MCQFIVLKGEFRPIMFKQYRNQMYILHNTCIILVKDLRFTLKIPTITQLSIANVFRRSVDFFHLTLKNGTSMLLIYDYVFDL